MDFFDVRRLLQQDLKTICEAAATGTAILLLPGALADLAFGTHLLDLLSAAALLALAIGAVVTVGARASAPERSD